MRRPSRPRATAELSKSLHQQLNTYALAAGAAGVSALALAQPAESKIVYTPAHEVIGPYYALQIDLNHDGISDFSLYYLCATNCRALWARLGVDGDKVWSIDLGNEPPYAAALRSGVRIGPSAPNKRSGKPPKGGLDMAFDSCTGNGCSHGGPWYNVHNRYLGFKFSIHGKPHYGWARLNVRFDRSTAVLTGHAYETIPGKAIIAGKTKGPDVTTVQPASLGHLAAGASAIPAWRVKRTAATTH